MAVIVPLFILGMGNFALHRAVLESGHPLLSQVPIFAQRHGRRVAFVAEYAILVAAMLLAANGWAVMGWAYLIYTLINGFSAWLILSGRI